MNRLLLLVFVVLFFKGLDSFSQSVVISEVYGGGGNSGATYKNDFIELYNPTNSPVDLTGWSVQYISSTGTGTWQKTNLSGSIAPKSYYLIQEAAGTGGTTTLPTPDATGSIAMAATAGKVALVSNATALSGASPSSVNIMDLVGFGSANFYEGSGAAPAPSNTNSIERKANSSSTSSSMQSGGVDQYSGNGYDSNVNSADFVTRSPEPQNSSSAAEPDTTPPTFTSSYPQSSNISSTSFDLVVNLNETGKAYYVVLADGATAPTAAQVKAGQDDQGNAVTNSGSISVSSSGANFSKTISGLTSSTNYDIYVVAEDAVFNLQSSATLLSVMTNVAPSITPSISFYTFSGFTEKSKQSSSASYTISAANLTADVNVSVSGNFLISSDNSTFTTSLNILQSNLSSPQTIYVKFNPAWNLGTQTGTITHSSSGASDKTISLSAVAIDPFSQNFNAPDFLTTSGWTQYSVTGAQTWGSTNFGHTCLTGCNNSTVDKAAQMNGYSSGAQNNEDWLISPQLDLTTFTSYPSLSFATISAFAGNALQLKYSMDYIGTGDPTLATWISLDGKFPPSNSSTWTTSSSIILPKNKIYVAFVYTSNTTAASRWTLDDWKVEDVSSYINVPSINFSFGEIVAGNHSSSQNFNFIANGYGDITVSVPSGFEASLDNITFTSNVIVAQADASAGETVYIRFAPPAKQLKWTGAINFTGNGLINSSGSLSGSSYPKSETFNIATYNLEFFGTDVKDATNVEFGPTDDALQVANVTSVLQTIAADIFAVEEISDDNAFNQLVSNLTGYDKVVSNRWSYSWQAPDPYYPPQKTGFIYNTSKAQLISSRVMFAAMYDSIIAGTKTLANYPTGTSSSFWSSGRLPFMATFDVTINGTKRRIRMIDIHGKSASDTESHNRRVYDAKVLHDSLNVYYPHDNIILLGDFNDQVYGSITSSAVSSYKIFVDDVDNFKTVTYDLNVSGGSTFPNSTSFIDNIIISNELINAYVINSVSVEDPRSYISNYLSTTSDHLPVSSRLLLSAKADQAITFTSLTSKKNGDAKFALSATASSGLPISFSSSDPAKVSLNGNVATILKAGSVTITASQAGSDDFNAAQSVDQSLTINKASQTITFNTIATKTFGDSPFSVSATASSGLAVTFSSFSEKVTVNGSQVTLLKSGRAFVRAKQAGNENYDSAMLVDQFFCINSAKPTISITNAITSSPTLTSSASSGNQWYFNGTAITAATNQTLVVNAQGTYKVQAHTDDCFSEFSNDAVVVIAGVEEEQLKVSIYPNPTDDYLFISVIDEDADVTIIDLTGRAFSILKEKLNNGYRVNVKEFPSGIYVLKASGRNPIQSFKFVRK